MVTNCHSNYSSIKNLLKCHHAIGTNRKEIIQFRDNLIIPACTPGRHSLAAIISIKLEQSLNSYFLHHTQ